MKQFALIVFCLFTQACLDRDAHVKMYIDDGDNDADEGETATTDGGELDDAGVCGTRCLAERLRMQDADASTEETLPDATVPDGSAETENDAEVTDVDVQEQQPTDAGATVLAGDEFEVQNTYLPAPIDLSGVSVVYTDFEEIRTKCSTTTTAAACIVWNDDDTYTVYLPPRPENDCDEVEVEAGDNGFWTMKWSSIVIHELCHIQLGNVFHSTEFIECESSTSFDHDRNECVN